MDVYTIDSANGITREFQGDLWYYRLDGTFTVQADTILISYREPDDEIKKIYFRGQTPPLTDTLYYINPEKLERRISKYRIPLYNKERDIPVCTVNDNGLLNLTIRDFGDPICILHKRAGTWVVVECRYSVESDYLILEKYQLPVHSGENEFRIMVPNSINDQNIKNFTFTSNKSPVRIKKKKVTDKIEFSDVTYYTIYDAQGKMILYGESAQIDCTSLISGLYFVEFDNSNEKIKKQ